MPRSGALVAGVVLAVVGVVFTLQGIGLLAGSPMTGVTLWAVVGPILVVLGLVLALRGRQRGGPHRRA